MHIPHNVLNHAMSFLASSAQPPFHVDARENPATFRGSWDVELRLQERLDDWADRGVQHQDILERFIIRKHGWVVRLHSEDDFDRVFITHGGITMSCVVDDIGEALNIRLYVYEHQDVIDFFTQCIEGGTLTETIVEKAAWRDR